MHSAADGLGLWSRLRYDNSITTYSFVVAYLIAVFLSYKSFSTRIDIVLNFFLKGIFFCSSGYLPFLCSDHGPVPWGLDFMCSTVVRLKIKGKWLTCELVGTMCLMSEPQGGAGHIENRLSCSKGERAPSLSLSNLLNIAVKNCWPLWLSSVEQPLGTRIL